MAFGELIAAALHALSEGAAAASRAWDRRRQEQAAARLLEAIKLQEDSASVPVPASQAPSEVNDGLSFGQKLFFIGAIVAVCALFLRSAGGRSAGYKPKSMA